MKQPAKPRSARKGKVRAEGEYADGSYFKNNGPMEVMDGQGYRPDPSVHTTDTDPGMPKPPPAAKPELPKDKNSSERNRILTSPLPLVVSAPEAIEKMEGLNELVQEGRPDLAQETEAVAQALDNLERKALGDQAFAEHEMAEGNDPANGAPTGSQFAVGDRVVMALDDGDYQGEIQQDNGDGTYDIKTDQMATFRRVPAQSIAKPDMMQPIAPKASKKELPMRKPLRPKAKKILADDPKKASEVLKDMSKGKGAIPKAIGEGVKKAQEESEAERASMDNDARIAFVLEHGNLKEIGRLKNDPDQLEDVFNGLWTRVRGAKVKADFMQKQTFESPGLEIDMKDGHTEFLPEEVYGKGNETVEGVAMFVDGEAVSVEKINGWWGRYSAPGYMDRTDWVFDKDKAEMERYLEEYYGSGDDEGLDASKKVKAAPAVAEATSPDINTSPANAKFKEGYKPVDGIKIVEDAGKPRAFKDSDEVIPADVYANPNGQLALVGPDGANYEDEANDEVELAYWKQVHTLIPEAPKAAAKGQDNAKAWADKAGVKAKKAKPAPVVDTTEADKLLAEHKVKADKFFVVAPSREAKATVIASDRLTLQAALTAGTKPDAILGIFADREAATKFHKIVAGVSEPVAVSLATGDDRLADAKGHSEEALELAEKGKYNKAANQAGAAAEQADRAKRRFDQAAEEAASEHDFLSAGSKVIASGTVADLSKDATFAVVIAGLKANPSDKVVILASKDGIVTARLDMTAGMKSEVSLELREMAKLGHTGAEAALLMLSDGQFNQEIAEADNMGATELADLLVDLSMTASKKSTDTQVEASAFDQIPELDIGGGMQARRKKGEKKDGAEGSQIEVVDKDGKVVATYPDAFGDDTVMIIKFLRQVLDIKETDDKKAGKAEEPKGEGKKKDDDKSAEDKPVVLPDTEKNSKPKKGEDKDEKKAELEARAKWMEARLSDARFVVEEMLRKGHVMADQADIDSELLNGKTLTQAQVVASRKAVDRKVMDLLSKPETELRVIKASLSHLQVRQVRVQASEGGFPLVNVSASGLIHEAPKKSSNLGMALTAAFRR